jgi:hypothetical protein
MEKLAVEFEDVSIVQAIPALAEDSIQLTVLLDGSSHFQARTTSPSFLVLPCICLSEARCRGQIPNTTAVVGLCKHFISIFWDQLGGKCLKVA